MTEIATIDWFGRWGNQTVFSENTAIFSVNNGIKLGFPCINICQVPREVLKTEVEDWGF